jgi:hypothetical protein
MYVENPEEYLTHRGSMLKPIEEKHSDVSITTRQHDLKIQDLKIEAELEEKQWKSCCFELHRESSLFFGKMAISLSVIALCSYQLITLKDCNYQSLYSSLLSSIITFWLTKKN